MGVDTMQIEQTERQIQIKKPTKFIIWEGPKIASLIYNRFPLSRASTEYIFVV